MQKGARGCMTAVVLDVYGSNRDTNGCCLLVMVAEITPAPPRRLAMASGAMTGRRGGALMGARWRKWCSTFASIGQFTTHPTRTRLNRPTVLVGCDVHGSAPCTGVWLHPSHPCRPRNNNRHDNSTPTNTLYPPGHRLWLALGLKQSFCWPGWHLPGPPRGSSNRHQKRKSPGSSLQTNDSRSSRRGRFDSAHAGLGGPA